MDNPSDVQLLQNSYKAFCAELEVNREEQIRKEAVLNGDIITDSDSDDPDNIHKAKTPFDESLKNVIMKHRMAIKRKASRLKAKRIVEKRLLGRKVFKTQNIIDKYPDIGEKIEKFVQANNVGADKWRRTGLLTFDGNVGDVQKVTYEKIRQHLQTEYNRTFAYGTVVQLCVARNKRRKSALRYQGVAQVTTRRARKGFQLRYNPDLHWSNSFYRGLNKLQLTDGRDIININRDDASGFRLDTLVTHKQYATPAVQDSPILTTHTDYVNRYPSTLQTTSYNFTGTENTPERCVGVVKAVPLFLKNPAQHASDFNMLKSMEDLQTTTFLNSNGQQKSIVCVRVDGAVDEGPSHEEVQFWWTLEHLQSVRTATLVTARSSGSSFLNRVELQNGCLTRGHANLFIPSTLNGYPIVQGKLDEDILKSNLKAAIDVYINRVNKSPCGRTVINLYSGSDSVEFQQYRENLKVFLKGGKTKKERLQISQPNLYEMFEKVWTVRSNHMVTGYPPQYVFFLLPCFKASCCHPVCQKSVGASADKLQWYL